MNAEALCSALLKGQRWLDQFRLKTYPAAFQAYREEYGPAYSQALQEAGEDEEALNALTGEILDGLEAAWKQERFWNRSAAKQVTKQVLVEYLTPMLLELDESSARTLCGLLRDGWTARWPRETYRIGSFERINGGFKNAIMGIEIGKEKPKEGEDL